MNIYLEALEHDMKLLELYSLCIIYNIIEMQNTEAEVQARIFGLDLDKNDRTHQSPIVFRNIYSSYYRRSIEYNRR